MPSRPSNLRSAASIFFASRGDWQVIVAEAVEEAVGEQAAQLDRRVASRPLRTGGERPVERSPRRRSGPFCARQRAQVLAGETRARRWASSLLAVELVQRADAGDRRRASSEQLALSQAARASKLLAAAAWRSTREAEARRSGASNLEEKSRQSD